MPLSYLIDEDLRGPLWRYVLRYNARGVEPIDAARVGDFDDLPLGTPDPEILRWCEVHQRVLVSHDRSTTPVHSRPTCPRAVIVPVSSSFATFRLPRWLRSSRPPHTPANPVNGETGTSTSLNPEAQMSNATHSYYDWQVSTLLLAYDVVDPIARDDVESLAKRQQQVELELHEMVHALLPQDYRNDPGRDFPPGLVIELTRATLRRASAIAGVV
jgi:hypothetical protein